MKSAALFIRGNERKLVEDATFEDGEHGSFNWQYNDDFDMEKEKEGGWEFKDWVYTEA